MFNAWDPNMHKDVPFDQLSINNTMVPKIAEMLKWNKKKLIGKSTNPHKMII